MHAQLTLPRSDAALRTLAALAGESLRLRADGGLDAATAKALAAFAPS